MKTKAVRLHGEMDLRLDEFELPALKENEILVNVRGIRDQDDYKYETTMERYNRDMYGDIITVYIPTPKELVHVSSSAMRNIIGLKGDLSGYVPSAVSEYIKNQE